MTISALEELGYDIHASNHAKAILIRDFPEGLAEFCEVLAEFRIDASELIRGGGGEASQTQRLRRSLANRRWTKQQVEVSKTVDGVITSSSTHEIDHFREFGSGSLALELEWNNKDPFFDRDLENFQRLHGDRAISVGIVVTRGASLQAALPGLIYRRAAEDGVTGFDDVSAMYDVRATETQQRHVERQMNKAGETFLSAWTHVFTQSKFGAATTHWEKLQERIARGVGGACPLLLLGIPASVVNLTADAQE